MRKKSVNNSVSSNKKRSAKVMMSAFFRSSLIYQIWTCAPHYHLIDHFEIIIDLSKKDPF